MQHGAAAIAYGNPLYRYFLQGHVPDRLHFLPHYFPAGTGERGQAIVQGQFTFNGENFADPVPPWQPAAASLAWREAMHGFAWLDDLRALGTETARRVAAHCVTDWLSSHDQWQSVTWAPAVLGERLAAWIGAAEFFLPAMPEPAKTQLAVSIARQLRHVLRLLPGNLAGLPAVTAYKGIVYAALNLPEDGPKALGLALTLLLRRIAEEILSDGGHVARSPEVQFLYLRHVLDIRAALAHADIPAPPELDHAITSMTPALRSLRHGDGGLGLFHGGQAGNALLIDQLLDRAAIRGRGAKSLPRLGFERLQAGRALLLCDAGMPPTRGMDRFAHAGLLSFEFSQARERLIVNCGGGWNLGDWRQALAATAAHSTVTVANTNAAEILSMGGIGRRPRQVMARSYELDGVHSIEALHDGYYDSCALVHERVLSLTGDGGVLAGRDLLRGDGVFPYALRFHLHPKVQCGLVKGGQAALLRTASGQGWQLQADGQVLALESSIYCGDGTPRRAQQIVIYGRSGDNGGVAWKLTRLSGGG